MLELLGLRPSRGGISEIPHPYCDHRAYSRADIQRAGVAEQATTTSTTIGLCLPALGDLMAVTQLRHLKLAWAADLKNWELANYEVDKVRNSFAVTAKLYPVFENVQLAKLIADVSEPALKKIDDSIKVKDHTAVMRAFKGLTGACNRLPQGDRIRIL